MKINKIYNEDCLITMANMPDNFVEYTLTSPPYNVNTERIKKYNNYKDSSTQEEYFEQQKKVITELLRVTKKHIFYNIQMLSGNKMALHKLIGYFAENIKEVIIWRKGFGEPAISKNIFNSAFEYIIILSNDEPHKRYFKDANFKRGTQSNIFEKLNTNNNNYSDVHKAIMPLDIPRYFMINFGNENDIWHDPYIGTGTTAVAAIKENRNYTGSEISKDYFDIANKRIKQYIDQLTLF